jgi:hypothetical protein
VIPDRARKHCAPFLFWGPGKSSSSPAPASAGNGWCANQLQQIT